jgi:hypothetical protein
MSIDICREVFVREVEIDDEIDLEDDEYGDNEQAVYGFAKVMDAVDWRNDEGDLMVTLKTTQGTYDFPVGHLIKLKVEE